MLTVDIPLLDLQAQGIALSFSFQLHKMSMCVLFQWAIYSLLFFIFVFTSK